MQLFIAKLSPKPQSKLGAELVLTPNNPTTHPSTHTDEFKIAPINYAPKREDDFFFLVDLNRIRGLNFFDLWSFIQVDSFKFTNFCWRFVIESYRWLGAWLEMKPTELPTKFRIGVEGPNTKLNRQLSWFLPNYSIHPFTYLPIQQSICLQYLTEF